MMRLPTVYTANRSVLNNIMNNDTNIGGLAGSRVIPPNWVPARPIGYCKLSLWTRLGRAWAVFTGKCDILKWEDGQ